jgi:hypothetical protein
LPAVALAEAGLKGTLDATSATKAGIEGRMARSRIALVTVLAGAALFSWTALGQEKGAPQTPEDAWYLCSDDGKPSGYLHMVKKASGQEAAPVLFVHDLAVNRGGPAWSSVHLQTFCKEDAYFSPVRVVWAGKGAFAFNVDARIERPAGGPSAGKLKATVDGEKLEDDIPQHTVTYFALFEVVRNLPFDKDKVFEFNVLKESGPYVEEGHKLTYIGREELDIEGKKQTLHKFEETGDGDPVSYWVSEDHQMVRMQADAGETEFLRTTKEKALAAFKAE